ncbi:hypothetical protein [Nocardiopsis sp. NRRL B-16309]|uniref:hypothetical protein n=1 Tax=Nocardiopsis sp. NRRL B-16309 TaxID=1519494 RepID=UPI0006AE8AF0|nr:hypothetical protein [Nocardiopsis sp. NRRL B-16309]KOX22134.1 hypothetical protein ADL05_03755 [Nocardiopsis sp. NRRL B-16309]
MENALTYEGGAFVNFRLFRWRGPWAHGFRWVSTKHLRFSPGSASDADLLAALIGHEQFRDAYAGSGVRPDEIRHGPYWLRLITPREYDAVGREECARVLREWANQYEPVPADLEAVLEREAFACVAAADRVHHLRELGDGAVHDWGRVQDCFHEFVLIDRSAGRITLLVATDD